MVVPVTPADFPCLVADDSSVAARWLQGAARRTLGERDVVGVSGGSSRVGSGRGGACWVEKER